MDLEDDVGDPVPVVGGTFPTAHKALARRPAWPLWQRSGSRLPDGRGYGVEYTTRLNGIEYSVSQGPRWPIVASSPGFGDLAYVSSYRWEDPDPDAPWFDDEFPVATWEWGVLLCVRVPGGEGNEPAAAFLAGLRRGLPEIVERMTTLFASPSPTTSSLADGPFEDEPDALWQLEVAERYRVVSTWPRWMARREPELFATPKSFTTQLDGQIYSFAQDTSGIARNRRLAPWLGIWPDRTDINGERPDWPGMQAGQVTLVHLPTVSDGESAETILRSARGRFPEILAGIRRLQAELGSE